MGVTAPPPGALLRSQAKLLLKAMSESVAVQQQQGQCPCSQYPREHFPGQSSHQGPHGPLFITGPTSLWMRHSGELALSLTGRSIWKSGSCALPRQHSGSGLGSTGVDEQGPQG